MRTLSSIQTLSSKSDEHSYPFYAKRVDAILKKIAGPYNDRIWVGKDYSLADLEKDLEALLS